MRGAAASLLSHLRCLPPSLCSAFQSPWCLGTIHTILKSSQFPHQFSCISLAFFKKGSPAAPPMPLLRKGPFQKFGLCSEQVCLPFNFPLQRFQCKCGSASPGCFALSAVNASLLGVFGYGAQDTSAPYFSGDIINKEIVTPA